MRIAIVVPRFGEDVSGGAELLGKWLAEQLAARGHGVDVFTTCALDHRMWRNELPAGTEHHGNLRVQRFPVRERDLGIHGELDRAITSGVVLSEDEELLWLRHGVSSGEMEDELLRRGATYDAVLALPYLYGTTYFTHEACPKNFVLIPCVHDEPYAHLHFVRRLLAAASGLMFNSDAEATLGRRLEPALAPWAVVGVGIELAPPAARTGRKRRNIPQPSMLYVGRRELGKNTPLLVEYFSRYKDRRRGDLKLVFVGSGDPVPPRSDVVDLQPDWESGDVYGDATIFCQPSLNESLSIVLLQAWLEERPAVVHGDCAVTRQHCERSDGGLWFTNFAEFHEVLDRLLASADLRKQLGRNGRLYVEREYSWDAVIGRFYSAMELLTGSTRTVTKVASDPD